MTAALGGVVLALIAIAFGSGLALAAGLRAGDRPGDTTVGFIEVGGRGRGIWVTVHNPGPQAVLVGASVRRRSLRLQCEGGSFVTVPRRTSHRELLAGRHAAVSAVAAGDSERLLVPFTICGAKRAELVVAIGEADRLRVVHRLVELRPPGPSFSRQLTGEGLLQTR